jgi:hypothetical protein
MIRMTGTDVPTNILDVIHHVSFPASTPISFDGFSGPQYTPGPFVTSTMLPIPEVTVFET